MHVHGNYSQQLASLGANRIETQEMAGRRAAEVRKKLFAASGAAASAAAWGDTGEAVAGVTAREDRGQDSSYGQDADKTEFGRHFSATA